jgi:adenosylmethionine-8-amino-7-oxononanoate aminotransferase
MSHTGEGRRSSVFYRKQGRAKPVISHGEGIYLWDVDGKRYIDASGGAVVVNVGHGIDSIADAMRDQAARVAYAHATMFTSAPLEELAARLAEHIPMPDARLFFLTSGSEATEAAMKFARQVQVALGEPGRYKTIGRWGSYHGATLGALAVMGKPSMRQPFAPMMTDMPHIPPPYCYRCPFNLTCPDCGIACADELEAEIKRQGPGTVAAFFAEPVGGATLGAVVPPDGYWPRIRAICDQYDILLIADEVMTGMGRTGRWFGLEHWGVQPDVVTLGKGVSGGYVPLSAVAARGELVDLVWNELGDFNHGGTFSHQPVGAAVGIATLDVLERGDLVNRAARMGELLGEKLRAAFGDHPHVGDVRGMGLMWALEFVADRKTKEPFPAKEKIAGRIFERAFDNGLIVYSVSGCADGWSGDGVMVAPPFIVEEAELDEIVGLLSGAVDAVLGGTRAG